MKWNSKKTLTGYKYKTQVWGGGGDEKDQWGALILSIIIHY